MKTNVEKPLALRFKAAKDGIYNAINKAHSELNIPFYLIEPIIDDIAHQVQNGVYIETNKESIEYLDTLKNNSDEEKEKKTTSVVTDVENENK